MLKTIFSTFTTAMGSSQSSLSQQSAVEIVNQWRSRPRDLIFDSGRHAVGQYLQALEKLRDTNAAGKNDKLISTAVERLKSEFDGVLRRNSEHAAGPTSTTEWSFSDSTANAFRFEDYTLAGGDMSGDVIECLRTIAERMSSIGKIEDLIRVYKNVRKPYLQSQLKRLRFDELRGEHNQRRYVPDELRVKMELWIEVSKICVKILFEKERNLCGSIFGDGEVRDECFVGTVKDFAVLLFRFAEDLSSRRLPYGKMGAALGVYDAFLWVLPSAEEDLFVSRQGKGIRDVCAQASAHIEDDVTRMLYDLKHDVVHEKLGNGASEDRGEVHPTTQVVMEQIDVIVKNKNLLTRLIRSPPLLHFGATVFPQEEFILYTNNSGLLEQHLILIILVLLKNLEKKSKRFQDQSLGHLFLMNNVRCILKAIEGSDDLQEMIGALLIGRMTDQLESSRTSYQTTTCQKFLTCLSEKGIYKKRWFFNSRPSKSAIRRRFNDFNNVFETIRVVHSSWKIPDTKLRDEVRRYMSEILVGNYTEFLEKFGNNPETRPIVEGNKKHSAEDLEALVQHELFANSEF